MKLLAHPFSITPGGTVATVDAGSDEHHAQLLEALIRTTPGERPLAPAFGLPDPTFRGINLGELRSRVELWGPPVTIAAVDSSAIEGGMQDVRIEFDRIAPAGRA